MKIVIFSQEGDASTTEVMLWLNYYQADVCRINLDDKQFKVLSLSSTAHITTQYGNYEIYPKDVVWFRRAKLLSPTILLSENGKTMMEDNFYVEEERETLFAMYHWIVDNCKYITNPFTSNPNKIHELNVAKKSGFLVPDTVFSTQKEDIREMLNKYPKLAVKPFTIVANMKDGVFTKSLTTLVQRKDLDKIPENFGGLIIQNYIEKKYELRSFFFEKEFYTMAIFSQNDDKTKIDFRNYNKEKPNKFVPFEIPKKYKQKLLSIAKELDLDTGSFDIIVDNDDNYYFLEVNPIGQFGMVSYPCNYHIEQKIAQSLINKMQNQ